MDKKGVEISMNVLIVAAIGLLVLVVLSIIFLGRIGTFSKSTADCAVQGGKCAIECGSVDFGTQNMPSANPTITCSAAATGEAQKCCIPVQ
jgi:hypothetical protein